MLGGMLVILLVGAFGGGTALGLNGLQISGSKRWKPAPANCAVGFAGVKDNWCNGRGDSNCCRVGLSGSKVPGTLCHGVSGKSCSSGLSTHSGS